MVRLLFALIFALVCWRTSMGVAPAVRLYRSTRAGCALAVAMAWTAVCTFSAAASLWLIVTS